MTYDEYSNRDKFRVLAFCSSLFLLCISLIACGNNGNSSAHRVQTNPPPAAPENRPPVLNPIGTRTVDEGAMLQFTVTASDPYGNSLA
jgi:hypothetical protein